MAIRASRRRPLAWIASSLGLLLTTGGAFAGCGSLSCTDVGCVDLVEVSVTGIEQFTLTMEVAGSPPSVRECPLECVPANGGHFAVFEGAPERATFVVRGPGGVELARETIRPRYRENRPNGPSCPPTCRSADVAIDVAAGT